MRGIHRLTPGKIAKARAPGLYADGGGLYLRVRRGSETKSWIFRWRDPATGKLRDMGLGSVDVVPLDVARKKAADYRLAVHEGRDPIEERKRERAERAAAAAKVITFDEMARRVHRKKAREFRNAKHAAQWLATLEEYASPVIGRLPVDQIELAHVVKVLEPIWEEKTETASRLRGRIETVLEAARVAGYRKGDNPASWKTLKHVLPAPGKLRRGNGGVKHHRALPWPELPAFMVELRRRDGMAARALEFAILTTARSGEVRHATWDEIDFAAKLWTVPAARMKAGRQHRVPLSEPAVRLLEALPRMGGSPYVFPAARGGPLSDMALSAVCRRMGVEAVPHGFRSSFKDWARSQGTRYTDEASELALAHVSSDQTRAAYARDELLPERTRLMRDWANFLTAPPATGDVVPLAARRRRR